MLNKIARVTVFFLCALSFSKLPAQMFGKNDVQYTQFDWHYIQSKHFDIYHYPGGLKAAEFVAAVAESALVSIGNSWDYQLRKRLVIVLYRSHNDFEQTNLNFSPPSESVGGFTEFYKNRIVIPYEGSYEQLRHVTHHELTHAVMLQMVFGTGVFAIVTGMMRANIPLWFVEGVAEYESRGWDIESDMFMRDALVNNYIPPIQYLYGFMAYKGGQSLLNFIAERYGKEKITELMVNVRFFKDIDTAIFKSIGLSIPELSEVWHKALRKKYWPEIDKREEPGARAHQLTSHRYDRNFINNSGELSPQGDKIAFLSDKSGYFDIYVISTLTGQRIRKLVSGQKSGRLEELHWLRPGIAWRPDGEQLVFAAKDRALDALNFVDIKTGKITLTKKFELDGIFSPDWSPNGEEIAFMGTKESQSDIYIYHLKNDTLRKLTKDIFSDMQPSWSPDGSKIVFISDRSIHTNISELPKSFAIQSTQYRQFDIYLIDVVTANITRVTSTKVNEKSPVWSPDGSKIAFVSELNGISNIYLKSMSGYEKIVLASTDKVQQQDIPTRKNEIYPITNVITGVDYLSWENQKLAFTSFYHGGYDIFLMTTPDDLTARLDSLQATTFSKKIRATEKPEKEIVVSKKTPDAKGDDLRNFVFGEKFRAGHAVSEFMPNNGVFLEHDDYRTANNGYKSYSYKAKFSADIIKANAGYDPFFGFQGASMVSFSDLMGNHRFNFMTDVFFDIKNSDFALSYFYLPRQTDLGVGIFQKSQLFFTDGRFLVRDRNSGFNLQMTRPYDKYRRLSYGFNLTRISRKQIADVKDENAELNAKSVTVTLFNISYVKDDVLWESTGPIAGSRYNFTVQASPGLGISDLDFRIYKLDYRTYFNFAYNYSAALRFSTGFSEGGHKQKFFLGGSPNWINLKFRKNISLDLDDVYFSNFISPIRGYDYYSQIGNKFFVSNFELRIPFINYLNTTWPIPLHFTNIRGNLFLDVGSTWEKDIKEVLSSFGWGARVNLGLFIIKYDMAWPTDFNRVKTPRHLVSLGADF